MTLRSPPSSPGIRPADPDAPWWRREALGWAGLAAAILVAYHPVGRAGFIWDDDAHVTPTFLQSLHGLGRIWGEPGATQQYYPVLYSAFWLEHRAWGDHPEGYHLLNLALHAAVAGLLFRLLRNLGIPGALFAAALFALHPVAVESVAWVSEQKNTLSTLFYLASALAYLRFADRRRAADYALGLALFVLALLSKSVTATLPAALLVVVWWRRGRVEWRTDVVPLLPWFSLGLAAGTLTSWLERTRVGASGPAFALSPVERVLVAGRALWFYLGKLLWPSHLTFIYPRWTIRASDPALYLYPVAALGLLVALWALRHRTRGPLAAGLLFAGSLVPALGFVNLFPFLYSYVADHFQYLAAPAIFAAAAASLSVAARRLPPPGRRAAGLGAGGLLVLLAALTWRQCAIYADLETLWKATIARNPSCWMAYNNLASEVLKSGRTDEAIADLRSALALAPGNAAAYATLGEAFEQQGRLGDAARQYEEALALEPMNAAAQVNYGGVLLQLGQAEAAAAHYERAIAADPDSANARTGLGDTLLQRGRAAEAAAQYRLALLGNPADVAALTNLGTALIQQGRPGEAIAQFERAVTASPTYPAAQGNLANALLQAGRAVEAIPHYEAALAAAPRSSAWEGNLGYALLLANRIDEAVAHLRIALRLDPGNGDAQSSLTAALAKKAGANAPGGPPADPSAPLPNRR